jgi:digeranylgeranylglycerophospholipid reductase
MKNISTDVVIVGAGPAGSTAAGELAKKGIDVLVLEKKSEIGCFKRCAEGITLRGLTDAGIKPQKEWALGHIKGARLYPPSGKNVVEMRGGRSEGYVVERKLFEKWLASNAIKAGARFMVKTPALELRRSGGLCQVKAQYMDESFTIETKLVLGADGVESKVGRWAGLMALNRVADYHSGFQYEMAGVNVDDSLIHLFFGTQIAPKGYLWIFPKKFSANVGLGILTKELGEKRPKDYLHTFIDNHPDIFATASPLEVNAGGVPVAHNTAMVTDNVILIGDAAQVVHPLHGGGIVRSIKSAQAAAHTANVALEEKNYSKKMLEEYQNWWEIAFGEQMVKLMKIRSFLERCEDKDFELLAEILSGEDILEIVDAKLTFFMKKLITKPAIARLVKKYLTG